jgi:hypothetical protein
MRLIFCYLSISEAQLSEPPLSVLHDNHSRAVTQEHALTTWDDASEEALDSLLLVYVLGAFICRAAKVIASCLGLILKDLEGPDNPKSYHGGTTAAQKLAHLRIKNICVTSHAVNDTEVSSHESECSNVQHLEACVSIG